MDNRGKTMVHDQFDFGFAVDWMRKDLGLVLDEARRNGCLLYTSDAADERSSVDLGGRRILKKKTRQHIECVERR